MKGSVKKRSEMEIRMARRRKKDQNREGKICISLILFLFIGVMTVKIKDLYEKDQAYIQQEAGLQQELAQEEARKKELEEYEAYTQTRQYIEDVAKSKLGLAYGNEIIFKEQK